MLCSYTFVNETDFFFCFILLLYKCDIVNMFPSEWLITLYLTPLCVHVKSILSILINISCYLLLQKENRKKYSLFQNKPSFDL